MLVEGIERVKVSKYCTKKRFYFSKVLPLTAKTKSPKIKALTKIVLEQFESYQKINKKIPFELLNNIRTYQDSNKISRCNYC